MRNLSSVFLVDTSEPDEDEVEDDPDQATYA